MRKSDLIPVMNLACLNLAVAYLIIAVLLNLGIPVASQIDSDLVNTLYVQLSKLYWAGFNEEITFRLLIFGLPLFIINGIYFLGYHAFKWLDNRRERDEPDTSKMRKRNPKNPLLYLTGGWKKLGPVDFLLLLFSSFLFGYVHYQLGYPYWQVGKIFQASVAGLIFGYAFYKYGLHAAIFLHVVNDFVIGMILTPNLGLILNGTIILALITVLGAFFLIYVLILPLSSIFKFLNRMFGRVTPDQEESISQEK
ncbi:MAG: CPBP family glutamic-type intramembrane protease [Candidatus Heimdallarchaeaceae archaeon]|jgi:hypothetical protein